MAMRVIEAAPSVLSAMHGRELLEGIAASGARTVVAEILSFRPALIDGVSNPGLAAAFGADIVFLNHYDVDKPVIGGLPSTPRGQDAWRKVGLHVAPTDDVEAPMRRFLSELGLGVTLATLRQTIGRVVGISLEILAPGVTAPAGRLATPETAARALQQGAAFIKLVGTPTVMPEALRENVLRLRQGLGEEPVLMVGRMPWGGLIGQVPGFLTSAEVEGLVAAGADVVFLPAPGTVIGSSLDVISAAVGTAHRLGALAAVTIGTSQESADLDTVRRLALDSKQTGADLYEIGDGGFGGMALPEAILAFAVAIKGKRHTYRRMAFTGI